MQFLEQTDARWRRTSYRPPKNTFRKRRNLHAVGKANTHSKNSYCAVSTGTPMPFVVFTDDGTRSLRTGVLRDVVTSKPHGEIPQGFGLTAPQIVNRLLCSVLSLLHKSNQVALKKPTYFLSTSVCVVCLVHIPAQTKHTEDLLGHFYRMQISPFSERVLGRSIGGATPLCVRLT